MFFRFPPDARWNAERSAVEFGIGVGEYEGVVRVGRRVFQALLGQAPTPERCLEAYHLHRTRLELIAERKVRRRQLTDDGNIEITGRDLREREAKKQRARWLSGGSRDEGMATICSPNRRPIYCSDQDRSSTAGSRQATRPDVAWLDANCGAVLRWPLGDEWRRERRGCHLLSRLGPCEGVRQSLVYRLPN